jgi:hypothetical protein
MANSVCRLFDTAVLMSSSHRRLIIHSPHITTKPALEKIIKGIIQIEEEDKCNQENSGKNKSH